MIDYSIENWTATMLCRHSQSQVEKCFEIPPHSRVEFPLPSGDVLCVEVIPGVEYSAMVALKRQGSDYKAIISPAGRPCKIPTS